MSEKNTYTTVTNVVFDKRKNTTSSKLSSGETRPVNDLDTEEKARSWAERNNAEFKVIDSMWLQ
jgi:hypothetical protein